MKESIKMLESLSENESLGGTSSILLKNIDNYTKKSNHEQ